MRRVFLDDGKVELKSQRNGVSNRVTMFTFNRGAWKLQQRQLIETYGYVDTEDRPSLYCTVSMLSPTVMTSEAGAVNTDTTAIP